MYEKSITFVSFLIHDCLFFIPIKHIHTHQKTHSSEKVKRMKKIKIIPCILFMIFRLKMDEKPLFNRIAVNNLLSLQFDTNLIETHTHTT